MTFIEKALEKTRLAARLAAAPVIARTPGGGRGAGESSAPSLPRDPARRIQIDHAGLRAAGMTAPADGQRRLAAQLRAIKSQLLKAVHKDGRDLQRVIMITSSLPGEGKTFSSINLALSVAAEKDYRVLLVDGDVAISRASTLFGLNRAPGLLDAVLDPDGDVEDLIVGTDVPGLDLLPAGRYSADATESLSSSRSRALIAQLALVPNRIVLIDSPPLLVTTEAAALAQHAGHVVLVVRANLTSERAVLDSLALLGTRDGLSLLLNDVSETGLDHLYYGYGRDYDYAPTAAAADAAAVPAAGTSRDA